MASVRRSLILALTLSMFVCGTLSKTITKSIQTRPGLFYRQCGERSSEEVSYFRSGDEEVGSGGCSYQVVKRSSNHCGMRVKLDQLEFLADCQTRINIEGVQKGKSIGNLRFPERQNVDTNCNTEAGNEYSFDIRNIDEVRVNVESSGGKSGKWKLRVTQVHCNEFDAATQHDSHIPAIWRFPFGLPFDLFAGSTTPRPPFPQSPRPPTPKPTDSSVYSRCGVKGPNTRSFSIRANNNNISEGESKPFIEDKAWGNPPRNESDHAETLKKLRNKIREKDPLAALSQVRITFGKDAGPREYPWQVAMKVRGRFHCGASIIGDQYILTAAHCVIKYKRHPTYLYLSLGDYDLSTSHEQPNYVPVVERVTVHPAYSRTTLRNDLAVLKLTKPIRFSSTIRPVCLAPAGFEPTGKIAIVTGWGRDENNRLQDKLQELAANVTTNNYCGGQWEKSGAPRGFITKDMMCMSPIGGDSCNGDSGGPSVMEIGGTYYQIGIVSFGSGSCVDESLPGVYTRVTSFRDWIEQQMN